MLLCFYLHLVGAVVRWIKLGSGYQGINVTVFCLSFFDFIHEIVLLN